MALSCICLALRAPLVTPADVDESGVSAIHWLVIWACRDRKSRLCSLVLMFSLALKDEEALLGMAALAISDIKMLTCFSRTFKASIKLLW